MDDILARVWHDLIGRASGPFHLRLLIQPAIALLFGIRDGLKDAREGNPPYFWTIFVNPGQRRFLIREGWHATVKIFVIAVGIDVIYQWMMLRFVYIGSALFIGFVLALLPYLLIRGPANRIARSRWRKRPG